MKYVRPLLQSGYRAAIVTLVLGLSVQLIAAQSMSSGSYRIESDSVNIGGGNSTSSNYGLESTVGEIATGQSSSTNYTLKAGYQQMQEVYLSLSDITNVNLLPALGGLTGGVASGTTNFVVITDSPAGYSVRIAAALAPAMQGAQGGSIANSTPAGAVPDFTFTTTAAQAHFGFTPEGTDVAVRYQDSGGVCGVAGGDTQARCWDMVSTTDRTIVTGSGSNHPDGATTTLRFQVGLGGNSNVTAGSYTATTTITALPL